MVSVYLHTGSALAERVGQGEMGGFTHSVQYTWRLWWLGCKGALVGTGWAKSCPGCMNGIRKHCCHLARGSGLAGKAVWVFNGCLLAENAAYCMFVNESTWLKS